MTADTMEPLLPCRFCKSSRATPFHDASHQYGRPYWTVLCEDCGARGPRGEDRWKAEAAWNRRCAPTPERTDGALVPQRIDMQAILAMESWERGEMSFADSWQHMIAPRLATNYYPKKSMRDGENRCHVCKEFLPQSWTNDSPDSWYSVNLNAAAAGGTGNYWVGIHHRCRPWAVPATPSLPPVASDRIDAIEQIRSVLRSLPASATATKVDEMLRELSETATPSLPPVARKWIGVVDGFPLIEAGHVGNIAASVEHNALVAYVRGAAMHAYLEIARWAQNEMNGTAALTRDERATMQRVYEQCRARAKASE